jgi:predicted SAM-dependent methyltransferase
MSLTFQQFLQLEPKYLNLGSLNNIHPSPHYQHYVGINPPGRFQNKIVDVYTGHIIDHPDKHLPSAQSAVLIPWTLVHDIEQPFPLPDSCVDRIHSEDCFEHIEAENYPSILKELHRIIKPGGVFRLAVPDYMNPKDRFCIDIGYDPRDPLHITLTTASLLRPILDASPFDVQYLHYWQNQDTFIRKPVDYTLGYVKRTPDNDTRNTPDTPLKITSFIADLVKR